MRISGEPTGSPARHSRPQKSRPRNGRQRNREAGSTEKIPPPGCRHPQPARPGLCRRTSPHHARKQNRGGSSFGCPVRMVSLVSMREVFAAEQLFLLPRNRPFRLFQDMLTGPNATGSNTGIDQKQGEFDRSPVSIPCHSGQTQSRISGNLPRFRDSCRKWNYRPDNWK